MKFFLSVLIPVVLCVFSAHAQDDDYDSEEEEEEETKVVSGLAYNGSEIGVDLSFSASNFGGHFGLGLKYGVKLGEYIIVGPSVRFERLWSKNATSGFIGNTNIYGGGAFIHARFFNALFLGVEFEQLKSPYNSQLLVTSKSSWAPTLFVGGGFSMELNDRIRLNAGVMYDVINATNSPFRNSYSFTIKDQNGVIQRYLPIILRVAFFFPLG